MNGMRDTCTSIADKVIIGKEIPTSVKYFFKKHKRFGFMTLKLTKSRKPGDRVTSHV